MGLRSSKVKVEDVEDGCLDRTFRRGMIFRCVSIVGIVVNFILFVIGFVITAFGARLGMKEKEQINFLDTQESVTPPSSILSADPIMEELETTMAALSVVTIGLTVMGVMAILISILGLVGAQSSKFFEIDKITKDMVEESAAAKELVKSNGRQALYLGTLLIVVEFAGFLVGVLMRFVIRRKDETEEWGDEMAELTHMVNAKPNVRLE